MISDTEVTNLDLDPSGWVLKYKSQTNWKYTIITSNEDLSQGIQYGHYRDTIQGIGSGNTSAYVISGSLPSEYSLAYSGEITGTTADTGWFNLSVQMMDNINGTYDIETFNLYVAPIDYIPGDVDGNLEINIADIVMLVNYMFNAGPSPANLNSCDENSDCTLDIADLVYFVLYQFSAGSEPQAGYAE